VTASVFEPLYWHLHLNYESGDGGEYVDDGDGGCDLHMCVLHEPVVSK